MQPGAPLCTLETTKSSAEVVAPVEGYVIGLRLEAGHQVRAGEIFCYLADSPHAAAPLAPDIPATAPADSLSQPDGLRITQPALALARQAGLDLQALPIGPLVTEKIVRQLLDRPTQGAASSPASDPQRQSALYEGLPPGPYPAHSLVLYGGGGHAKIIIDLLRALGRYELLGIVDDGRPTGERVMGVPVLGGSQLLEELQRRGVHQAVNCVGGIGNPKARVNVSERLAQAGFSCPAVIHPTAIVEPGAEIGAGAHILARAYIGSEARIGVGCIVSTGAIISHDCILDDYANVSPGAILAGEVQVGTRAQIGMGVTINLRVQIGPEARLGNGATVKSDVPAQGIVRAGAVWPAS